ncbi:MAG: DUF2085 domain-containing protein [Anaerolineaceae bacterium]|nr:DUF2085 domain-containing protein [Anaerolineaceae bacterium]
MVSAHIPSLNDKKFEVWFRNHYLSLILGFLLIFSILPIIAPILMRLGLIPHAKVIYWIYGFFCHQLPFRSWFLFGAQPYYPLADVGMKSILSFETVFNPASQDFESFRTIFGNPYAGYKIAICQRDIAMYFSLIAFGLFFASQNRKIKRIHFWIWMVVGVIPLGIDGIMQFLGGYSLPVLSSFLSESTPLLRTITGNLFGFFTGWYIFPTLELMINRNIMEKRES